DGRSGASAYDGRSRRQRGDASRGGKNRGALSRDGDRRGAARMSGMSRTRILDRRRRLHFIGIGGAGMSGIAELCQRLGFAVSGCDLHQTAVTTRLAELGIAITYGHHPGHLGPELDAVVISSAVK